MKEQTGQVKRSGGGVSKLIGGRGNKKKVVGAAKGETTSLPTVPEGEEDAPPGEDDAGAEGAEFRAKAAAEALLAAATAAAVSVRQVEVDADHTIVGDEGETQGQSSINPLDQSQRTPTTPDSSFLDDLEGVRRDRVGDGELDAEMEEWAEDIAGVNSRSSVPTFTAALRLCQERVQDAEQKRREDLLDDVGAASYRPH